MSHTKGKLKYEKTKIIPDRYTIACESQVRIAIVVNNNAEANARRICQCVNSHDALLAACENLISEIDKDDYPTHTGMALLYKDELITAIAKAKEQL